MRDYAITTDSSCDFDQALADSLGVTVVPLSVQIGPRRFRNAPGEAMDSHSFYQLLRQGELAQTSAPNVEEFKAVWRPILQSGRDLLYLGFSSGLSGTYHNAAIAAGDLREEFPEARIITVDTLCASLGQGMLVDLTVQEKRQGKTLDEAAAFAEKNRLYLCHWFTVGDLSQLRRGGRLSAGKAIVGNLLNIKPVLHVDDAAIEGASSQIVYEEIAVVHALLPAVRDAGGDGLRERVEYIEAREFSRALGRLDLLATEIGRDGDDAAAFLLVGRDGSSE